MPKQRITKEMVLSAAFDLLREQGEEQVLVKNIAAALSCSVQPIYSYCESMDILRQELFHLCGEFMRDYVRERLVSETPFESTGKAYISFAKEEPNLFRFYFLQKRSALCSFDELYAAEASAGIAAHLSSTLHINVERARLLHSNMIIFTTGLSFLMLSAGNAFPEEMLSEKLDSAYRAFLAAARQEEELS